jgi:hypothetical protein
MELTRLQKEVLRRIRRAGADFIAAATERHWREGEPYYLDDRAGFSPTLRTLFKNANPDPDPEENQ